MQYSAEETIAVINAWDEATKAHFHRLVSVNLTISIRVMIKDSDDLSAEEKLSEINLLNEFHHRFLSWRIGNEDWQSAEKLFRLLRGYAEKMKMRGAIEFPVASAFETVRGLRTESN